MRNIKNIIYGLLVLLFISVACKDNGEEYLFDQNVNKRFETLKSKYNKTLTSAKNGWVGYYAPNDKVGGFVMLFKFTKGNKVRINSDYALGDYDTEITYRIDKNLKIQLVLESHAVLQQIYETDRNGVDGEYVFNILSVTEDTVELESATDFGYDGSGVTKLTLKKATKDQWDLTSVYENTSSLTEVGDLDLMKFLDYSYKKMYVKGTKASKFFEYVEGQLGAEINRYAKITTVDKNGEETVEEVPLFITYDGFSFTEPYEINGIKVQKFVHNKKTNTFVSKDGGKTTVIENTAVKMQEEDAMKVIKKFNRSIDYSYKFEEDYLVPLKAVLPNFTSLQLYNNYVLQGGFVLKELDIYRANKKPKWSGAYFSELKTTVRKDVIRFVGTGKAKGAWLDAYATDAGKKFYDFFFNADQEFFIKRLNGGFILFDRDKPEYFIVFKS